MTSRRIVRALWLVAVAAALSLPAVGWGDVVKLRDGSTIKGRVLSIVHDTLTVETGFGATLRVPRPSVLMISFTDSIANTPALDAGLAQASGTGRVGVTFVDNGVSSKIAVDRGRDKRAHLRANWIEVVLLSDDQVVYTNIDSTMDKTIYNGPERVYKNSIEIQDFEVELPTGLHHLTLVVRNVGRDQYEEAFDGDPLEMTLPLDNIQVPPDRTVRVKVGISRGKFRMGQPRFYRVE